MVKKLSQKVQIFYLKVMDRKIQIGSRMTEHISIEVGLAEDDKTNMASNIQEFLHLIAIPHHKIDLNQIFYNRIRFIK